jgi:glycerophosphoryl diester phosphodiesterase
MKKISLFIGNRGTLVDYDENTLEAFDIAIKSGVNLELDVRLTKDRKLIVFHD